MRSALREGLADDEADPGGLDEEAVVAVPRVDDGELGARPDPGDVLGEPHRVQAVGDLLQRTPDSEGTRARRLLLRGRCEAALGRLGDAVVSFFEAAEAASEQGQAPFLEQAAARLTELIDENPADDGARIARASAPGHPTVRRRPSAGHFVPRSRGAAR